jgi:hypothetical protein
MQTFEFCDQSFSVDAVPISFGDQILTVLFWPTALEAIASLALQSDRALVEVQTALATHPTRFEVA